jgi:hypothetical protein
MRTVFVNPARKRRRRRKASNPRRHARRRSHGLARRRNAGITPFVQNPLILDNPRRRRRARRNPSIKHGVMDFLMIAGGALGGAGLNRLGLSQISNIYVRNAVRIGAAGALAFFGGKSPLTAAAAGATLAPMLIDIELELSSTAAPTKNPRELAAELSALLEADLSDDDLEDDDLEDDDLEDDVSEMTW